MLQIRLLGQFDVRLDGKPVAIASRAGQSLFAFLALTAGTVHRREKLAGMLWPDTTDENARRNLRQDLWRIRKATAGAAPDVPYLVADELAVGFNAGAEYWLDAAQLEHLPAGVASSADLIARASLYRGELLPGFYDDWVVLERERLQAHFEQTMQELLQRLIGESHWQAVLEWSERWIALGHSPEAAYRALMLAHAAWGNTAQIASTYERCQKALRQDLGVEPSGQTRALYERLVRGEPVAEVDLSPIHPASVTGWPAPHPTPGAPEEPAPGEPPFQGLEYFNVTDADRFFGREELTARLVGRLRESCSLLVVVGASGSGKSSLVRAGLVPALRRGVALVDGTLPPEGSGGWQFYVMTPTARPLRALAATFTRRAESVSASAALMDDLARDPRAFHLYLARQATASKPPLAARATRILLVIDQFEELFTLCRDEFEREAFVDNLLFAREPSRARAAPLTLVLALRADFYAHLSDYPELRGAIAEHQEYIGPMTAQELRRAIEEPARQGHAADGAPWEFEPGLVDLILRDTGDEPGALPLLSHALLETWKRRQGHVMKLAGYADTGGVRGAIARTAETFYEQLSPEQQAVMRDLLLRLTELGEGTEDTRRRASLGELVPPGDRAENVRPVLQALADARLVTLGEDTAEVAHEALIREWPRLREWLNEDRDGLRLHRHLTEAARDWELLERDPGALYRGARLAQAREESGGARLNESERAFLDASTEQERQEEMEHEAARQRELEAAEKLAEEQRRRAEEQVRAARELRRRAVFLAGAFVTAVLLALIALFLGDQARVSAVAAQANASAALQQEHIASARELAANSVSQLTVDPERSILLALASVDATAVDHTVLPEAEAALHRAVQSSHVQYSRRGHKERVVGLAYSSDGARLASFDQFGTIVEWDTVTGKELLTISRGLDVLRPNVNFLNKTGVFLLGYSPDGSQLMTNENNTVSVWDARSGQRRFHFEDPAGIWGAIGSPDGKWVVAGSGRDVKMWDAATGAQRLVLSGHSDFVLAVAMSADGKQLASTGLDQTVKLWDAQTGELELTLPKLNNISESLAFSPDGKLLAASTQEGWIYTWKTATGELFNRFGSEAGPMRFTPDSRYLVTANLNGTVTFLDASTGKLLMALAGHKGDVTSLALGPDGQHVASGGDDGTVKIWDTRPDREVFTVTNNGVAINRVAYSPDGTRFVTGSDDGTIKMWDAATGEERLTIPGEHAGVYGVDFSPDGTRLAASYNNNLAKVFDLQGNLLLTLRGHEGNVRGIEFTPDGKRIVTGSFDQTIRVWDATTGEELLRLTDPDGAVTRIALSPDGTRVAAAYSDGRVVVWDLGTAKPVFTLTGHTGPVRGVAYDPRRKLIATAGDDKTVKVWDATNGQQLYIFRGHSNQVWPVAFSRDGTRIVSGSVDQTAMVWESDTGKILQVIPGHTSGVYGATFSPDGTRLLTASDDGTARVYLLKLDELVALARSRLTRTWTFEECQKFLHADACPVN